MRSGRSRVLSLLNKERKYCYLLQMSYHKCPVQRYMCNREGSSALRRHSTPLRDKDSTRIVRQKVYSTSLRPRTHYHPHTQHRSLPVSYQLKDWRGNIMTFRYTGVAPARILAEGVMSVCLSVWGERSGELPTLSWDSNC